MPPLPSPPFALVYPAFHARYYSLYVWGLLAVLGRSRVRFTGDGFPPFGSDCLAVRLLDGDGNERRLYLHSDDPPELDAEGLAWADHFGKVNLDVDGVPVEHASKVFALGPTFAVRVWPRGVAEIRGLLNHLRTPEPRPRLRKHLANYRGQYASRFPESEYRPGPSERGYVFFNAAIWEREPEANALRARFIDACRSLPGVRFEGGLSPRRSARGSARPPAAGFERYLHPRAGAREYLEKTRRSAVVLNNPAYRSCHSWRLAESLAFGKAIVSTPIVRALPAPLVHGRHLHLVDGSSESLRSALARITGDEAYRMRLEREARAYYERYLAPTSVVQRILRRTRSGPGSTAPAPVGG